MNEASNVNLLIIIGVFIFAVGVAIFCFGKKLTVLRYLLGDRSMFSQFIWGGILGVVGLLLLYLGGSFK